MKITMSRTCIVAAAYTEAQRVQMAGYRRELSALAITRAKLVARRTALKTRYQTETTAASKKMLLRELGHVREQIKEIAARKIAVMSKLADLRLSRFLN